MGFIGFVGFIMLIRSVEFIGFVGFIGFGRLGFGVWDLGVEGLGIYWFTVGFGVWCLGFTLGLGVLGLGSGRICCCFSYGYSWVSWPPPMITTQYP